MPKIKIIKPVSAERLTEQLIVRLTKSAKTGLVEKCDKLGVTPSERIRAHVDADLAGET